MEEKTLKIDFSQLEEVLKLQEKVTLYERAMCDMLVLLHEKKYHPVILYGDEFGYVDVVFKEIIKLYPKERKDV